jgi:hypothetical protein
MGSDANAFASSIFNACRLGIRRKLIEVNFTKLNPEDIPVALNLALMRTLNIPRSNPLQPSECQVNILRYFKDLGFSMSDLPLDEWCKIAETFWKFLYSSGRTSDLSKRSTEVFSTWCNIYNDTRMANKYNTKLVIMDGHGRIVAKLLNKISKTKSPQDFIIKVVDVDPIVTEWHKLFFPAQNVVSCTGNILEYSTEDNLVYMNFCGLGNQKVKVMNKCTSSLSNFFLSFSTARNAKKNIELLDLLKDRKMIGNTKRQDFVSCYVAKLHHDKYIEKCVKQARHRPSNNTPLIEAHRIPKRNAN